MPGPALSSPNWNSSRLASGSLSERSRRSGLKLLAERPAEVLDDALPLGQIALGCDEDPDCQLARLDHRIVAVLQHGYPFDAAARESGLDVFLDQLPDVVERCLLHSALL